MGTSHGPCRRVLLRTECKNISKLYRDFSNFENSSKLGKSAKFCFASVLKCTKEKAGSKTQN